MVSGKLGKRRSRVRVAFWCPDHVANLSWIGGTTVRAAPIGRHLVREEKARIFRSAASVVNTLDPAELGGANARLPETAGYGAAVFTEFRLTVPELSAEGEELQAAHDFDDLVEQPARLLRECAMTARLNDSAEQRAYRDRIYNICVIATLEKVS